MAYGDESATGPGLPHLGNQDGHAGAGGELNAEIARAIVGIYRDVCGRGPTKARATFRGDVIVVVLENVLTPPERSLIASGRAREAETVRRDLHDAMRAKLARAVSRLTGSEVRAVMGESEHNSDMAVEVFVLDTPVDPSRLAAGTR